MKVIKYKQSYEANVKDPSEERCEESREESVNEKEGEKMRVDGG